MNDHTNDPRAPIIQARLDSDPAYRAAMHISNGAMVLHHMLTQLGLNGTAEQLGRSPEQLIVEIAQGLSDIAVALGWALVEAAVAGHDIPEATDADIASLFRPGPDFIA